MTADDVPALHSSHEEADTRMLLHAYHAAQSGSLNVVLRSPDTDVAVIACALSSQIPTRLLFRTGTKTRTRFVDITAICLKEGQLVVDSLIGLHALTAVATRLVL